MPAETILFGRAAADTGLLLRVPVSYRAPAVECCQPLPEQTITLAADSPVLADVFAAGNSARVTLDLSSVVAAISERVQLEGMLLLAAGEMHQACALLAAVEAVLRAYR